MYVVVHVDDVVVAHLEDAAIDFIADKLHDEFEITDLGNLKYYLGIHFERDQDNIFAIHQETYINKVLKRHGMSDAKPSKIPIDPGYLKRKEVEDKLHNNDEYRKAIGALLYISTNTRPDIAASVSITSRKVNSPSQADWVEVKRIMRYLKGTIGKRLVLGDVGQFETAQLLGYADADWASDSSDRKSNSGFIFKLCGGTISWASRKQQCVTLSSTEAEYVALSEATQEVLWLKRLLNDLHQNIERVVIKEDNQSCLRMLEKSNQRTKRIHSFHFIKDVKKCGDVDYEYCPTTDMIADILTKPLAAVKTARFTELIGVNK